MSGYTPSVDEVRERYIDGFPIDTWVVARNSVGEEFDRMIEAVRAEEREKAAQIVEKGRDAWADVYLPTAFDAIARLIREQGKEHDRG